VVTPDPESAMHRRVLQLSDPHLVADPDGEVRQRLPLPLLRHGLSTALHQLRIEGTPPDLLLISGDLCHEESWNGYVRLRELLEGLEEPLPPVALLAGNHDHPHLLRSVLGRQTVVAPAIHPLGGWHLLLLDSHRPTQTAGWLGHTQLDWLEGWLQNGDGPVLVAVHHPPGPIGDSFFDTIALRDGAELMERLGRCARVRGLVFGHVHQHWQGHAPGHPHLPMWGCPSTLRSFTPVQPCSLGRPDDPGGRLLELGPRGEIRQRLLRWSLPDSPTFTK